MDICMNFIISLPKSNRKEVIFMVVDRLSKYGHFVALSNSYVAHFIAQVVVDEVYQLRRLSNNIVSVWDYIFMSTF